LEVNGVWYGWTGPHDLKGSWFPSGRAYHDIPVSLGRNWKASAAWFRLRAAAKSRCEIHSCCLRVSVRQMTANEKRAFTLIELLVAIAIIGILAALRRPFEITSCPSQQRSLSLVVAGSSSRKALQTCY